MAKVLQEVLASYLSGCSNTYDVRYHNLNHSYPLKVGIIYGISFKPNTASLWGDNISFDVPLVMTPEELIENSGEPRRCEYGMYGYSACGRLEDHTFEFDDNDRLISFTIQKITWG